MLEQTSEVTGDGRSEAATPFKDDPLGFDLPADDLVMTTRRAMVRVALVAAETATKFERDGVPYDPMAWMLAPRSLFAGASAIDACRERKATLRALVLHRTGLGVDADPNEIDELIEDGEELPPNPVGSEPSRKLYTGSGMAADPGEFVQHFMAAVATSADEARAMFADRGLRGRSDFGEMREGFDPTAPLVDGLLSPAVTDILSQVACDPGSPLGDGLKLLVEQRFSS